MTQLSIFSANPAPLPDITRRKHGGNARSEKANERVHPFKVNTRERVRIFVDGCGFNGATLKEICKAFDKYPNELSGRLTELVAEGKVFKSGRERGDCEVYVSRRDWANGSSK